MNVFFNLQVGIMIGVEEGVSIQFGYKSDDIFEGNICIVKMGIYVYMIFKKVLIFKRMIVEI